MKLREDWNNFYKFISVRAIALAAAVQVTWPMIPQDMKSSLPTNLVTYLTVGLLALSVYGVMTKQNFDAPSN